MRTVRRWLRTTSWVALFIAAVTATSVWHVADDDLACRLPGAAVAGSEKSLSASGSPQVPPQHCVLCHWNRWIRAIPSSRSEVLSHGLDVERVFQRPTIATVATVAGLIPGRSPPLS